MHASAANAANIPAYSSVEILYYFITI